MTDSPADQLTAAAQLLIDGRHPIADSNLAWALAELLKDAAHRQRSAEESAHRVWQRSRNSSADDIDDRDRWIAEQVNKPALALARQILGQVTE